MGTGLLIRFSILLVGVGLALLLVVPLALLTESGSKLANAVSCIGSIGFYFLIIGGIVGAITKRWIALVPGTILVLFAFTLMICCWYINPERKENDEMQINAVGGIAVF